MLVEWMVAWGRYSRIDDGVRLDVGIDFRVEKEQLNAGAREGIFYAERLLLRWK